ncbi:uncharacterized protein LOC124132052 [Haliotis rufescens]|uniref:uncharacterized protein LOC124132052 n=1 Tax=Haliotis rufescens TaxID=6454 RepID=UPI00201FA3CD|nr:uncharacterized protein LOC124132052 [Haliotis rufescens]XP_046351606.2 uncharacterized protein LOC124132052 [Haliotis rufescens]XP_046351607.2 uncharacterized protein LOC124132052 [Haliotis rufescens]XP_046351608.2 uncharacterized protein LOC124132052 [Haliotis rufescens]XP_046351609.2 uncharacterized protein LOC124132052 [Haliotis rufescens]XP_046351610.2 uncharacterized protein LOC124132052 [Haliotis rufescens]
MKMPSQALLKHMQWLLLLCAVTIPGASAVDSVTPRLPGNDSTLGTLQEHPNYGDKTSSHGTGDTNITMNISEPDNMFFPVTMETSNKNHHRDMIIQKQDKRQEESRTVSLGDVSASKTYDIISWLPKPPDKKSMVNLTILPILAMLAFLIGLCLKGCTWFRESLKESDRDSMEDDRSFIILQEGDEEYHDVDFRSNLSTPYDTYSSYMSFLKRNNNDTVTSFRSLQNQPYDTVTSYRSLMLQHLNSHNNDSVNSYRALMQRMSQMKDVEVQVELLDEKPKDTDQRSGVRSLRSSHRSKSTSPKLKRKYGHGESGLEDVVESTDCVQKRGLNENGDVFTVSKVATANGIKRHYDKSPNRHTTNRSPTVQQIERSPVRRLDNSPVRHLDNSPVRHDGGRISPKSSKVPRFKVSFVTDDEEMARIKADNVHSPLQVDGKLSPTTIKLHLEYRSCDTQRDMEGRQMVHQCSGHHTNIP